MLKEQSKQESTPTIKDACVDIKGHTKTTIVKLFSNQSAAPSEFSSSSSMEKNMINTILISGPPGVGKTTLVRNICNELALSYNCYGFITEEVRSEQSHTRTGFDVVTLHGERSILAREQPLSNQRMPKVGKYSVYVKEFENLVLPLLVYPNPSQHLLVIDEIGKMELRSQKFEKALNELINKVPILATIPWQTRENLKFVEYIKNSPRSCLFVINKSNRSTVQNDIVKHVKQMLKGN